MNSNLVLQQLLSSPCSHNLLGAFSPCKALSGNRFKQLGDVTSLSYVPQAHSGKATIITHSDTVQSLNANIEATAAPSLPLIFCQAIF